MTERKSRYVKVPRVGESIHAATGVEEVTRVEERGRRVWTRDALGRPGFHERADNGVWTIELP